MDVDGTETVDGLEWWSGPGQDAMAAFGRVSGHRALNIAVRRLAANMLDLFAGDPRLAHVLKDAGCYMAAMLAFLLDETGELTLTRLKAACASSGLLSVGRARALFQSLEHVAYVAPRGSGGAYALTADFRAAWTLQLRAALDAALPLEPGLARLMADPHAVRAFGRVHAAGLLESTRSWGEPPLFLKVFQHPHAGAQILWVLILSGDAGDDFAPARSGPISISALSRRFDVSRMHVKRIFQEAERHGLARLDGDGAVRFEPAARRQMRGQFVSQMAHILAAAGRAAQDHGLAALDGRQKCAVGVAQAAE